MLNSALILIVLIVTATMASAQTVADAQRQATTKYPALAQEGSVIHSRFLALYNDAKQNNPKLLLDPNWPMILADRASQPNEIAEQLMRRADTALRANDFPGAADALNRIKADYASSPQSSTVITLRDTVRDKQHRHDGPFTPDEAQKIRSSMDAFNHTKASYPTDPPERQRALERVFGADILRDTSISLESFAKASAKLLSTMEEARQSR